MHISFAFSCRRDDSWPSDRRKTRSGCEDGVQLRADSCRLFSAALSICLQTALTSDSVETYFGFIWNTQTVNQAAVVFFHSLQVCATARRAATSLIQMFNYNNSSVVPAVLFFFYSGETSSNILDVINLLVVVLSVLQHFKAAHF